VIFRVGNSLIQSTKVYVDHLFQLGVNSMFHEICTYWYNHFEDFFLDRANFAPGTLFFVIGISAPLRGIIL
jgi:hypothetical protein